MPDKPWCSPAWGIQQAAALVPDENESKKQVFSTSMDYEREINALVMKKALVWISNKNRSADEFIRTGRNLQRQVVWFGLDQHWYALQAADVHLHRISEVYILRIENHWFGQEIAITFVLVNLLVFQAFSELSGPSRVFRVNGKVLWNWTLISDGKIAL